MLDVKPERQKIDLATPARELVFALGEGNRGATNAMVNLLVPFPPPHDIYLNIDDMNLRGPRLAAAFTVAERDSAKLEALVRARDQKLVEQVNQLAGGSSPREQAMCRSGSDL